MGPRVSARPVGFLEVVPATNSAEVRDGEFGRGPICKVGCRAVFPSARHLSQGTRWPRLLLLVSVRPPLSAQTSAFITMICDPECQDWVISFCSASHGACTQQMLNAAAQHGLAHPHYIPEPCCVPL